MFWWLFQFSRLGSGGIQPKQEIHVRIEPFWATLKKRFFKDFNFENGGLKTHYPLKGPDFSLSHYTETAVDYIILTGLKVEKAFEKTLPMLQDHLELPLSQDGQPTSELNHFVLGKNKGSIFIT